MPSRSAPIGIKRGRILACSDNPFQGRAKHLAGIDRFADQPEDFLDAAGRDEKHLRRLPRAGRAGARGTRNPRAAGRAGTAPLPSCLSWSMNCLIFPAVSNRSSVGRRLHAVFLLAHELGRVVQRAARSTARAGGTAPSRSTRRTAPGTCPFPCTAHAFAARRLDEDVVIAAQVERVLGQLHAASPPACLSSTGPNNCPGLLGKIRRLACIAEISPRDHVHKPRRPKADHALVRLRKQHAGRLVVKPVGFKRAVDAPPVDPADDVAVVDASRRPDRLVAAEPPLQAVPQIFHAQQLHRPVRFVGEQVDRPTSPAHCFRNASKSAAGSKSSCVIEDRSSVWAIGSAMVGSSAS